MDYEPPYVETIRQIDGKKLARIDVERLILKQWRAEFSQFPDTKKPAHLRYSETLHFAPELPAFNVTGWTLHLYHFIRLLWPSILITPELLRMIQAVEQTRLVEDRKIVNFIGHKNGGKTQFFSIIALALICIDPQATRGYISGPYKGSADAIVWGRLGGRFNQIRQQAKGIDWLMHCREEPSKNRYVIWPGSDEFGYVELITLDKVGKLQGAKSAFAERGWLIVVCDEVNQFPTRAFLDVLENIKGNRNLLVLTGCNFKTIEGMDGDLCRPEGREFSELKIDFDFDWLSAYSSHTWRFDGHRCSNVTAGRIVFPGLLDEKTRAESEHDHGLNGPKYYEQIRSFPNSSMSDFFVLTREKVRAGGGYDEFEWKGVEPVSLVFCDPGFGGDPCKIGLFKFGRAFVPTTSGQDIVMNVFEAASIIATIQLDIKQKCDTEWIRRVTRVARGEVIMKPGSDVPFEMQIAIQAAEFCMAHEVPYNHFGFDGSMRSGIVQAMDSIMGTQVQAIDPQGQATDRNLPFDDKKVAREEYFNFVSEEHFNFGSLVYANQFRGGDRVPAAIAQICRRPWSFSGAKKQIQPKKKYKEDNGGRSPDDGDVLVGGFEMALRLGFITVHSRRPSDAEFALDALTVLRSLGGGVMVKKFGSKKLGNH